MPPLPVLPAGTYPAGTGTPTPWAGRTIPARFLADNIDPQTGEFLDVLDGVDPTDAWITTQLRTARGTGIAVLDEGHNIPPTAGRQTTVRDTATAIMIGELQVLLRPLVLAGDITIELHRSEEMDGGDGVASYLIYTNLRTGQKGQL